MTPFCSGGGADRCGGGRRLADGLADRLPWPPLAIGKRLNDLRHATASVRRTCIRGFAAGGTVRRFGIAHARMVYSLLAGFFFGPELSWASSDRANDRDGKQTKHYHCADTMVWMNPTSFGDDSQTEGASDAGTVPRRCNRLKDKYDLRFEDMTKERAAAKDEHGDSSIPDLLDVNKPSVNHVLVYWD